MNEMVRLTVFEFSASTAEDGVNYFTGETALVPVPEFGPLPPGSYRLLEGDLYRIVDQPVPTEEPEPETETR